MADITDLEMEGFLKRKRENTSSPSISPLNKRKPEICTVDRNNASNKWTSEEKNNLLATVTECTSSASTEWKSVSESLNVMFGSNRTAKSCKNQYKRIMAFKDTAHKVEMVNSSCQTDISLNPNDNFVFMKMEEEFIELSTNASDSVDTAYESESSSSVLRTMLLDDSFLPCLTSTPKKQEKVDAEKVEGKVMPEEKKPRVCSDHNYTSSLPTKSAKRHIGAPGKRVEKFNKIIPHLTGTTNSKLISTKDIVLLRHAMSSTRNTKNMSKIIMSIEPLREAILTNLSNTVGDRPNEMRNNKKGYTSYLMEKGPESLEELNIEKVIEELKNKFPELLQMLICIMLPKENRSSDIALANILPRLAMIYGMIMQSRYHELSRIQRVIAMCLADNICDQSVYDRLNRLGVSSSYCVAVDTITKLGKRYTGFLVKFLEEGKFIRLIGDNLNFTVGTSHETKSQHKHMVHMFTSLALISDHHFLTKPIEPEISINHLSIDNILLSKQEYEIIRHEVIELIIDTAVKFLPNIAFLKQSKPLESAYISAKTEVIPLPCLPYNENKYQDDVKILAWYQQLLDTIKKEAGADAELKFVIGGDQLTRERLSEAILLRFGNIDPQERFSHIGRCLAEFFHLGMNYLEKVIFGELWNVEGVVEKGTLRGECERISRKTVDPKIMKAYEADKDFVDNYLSANIIEALMSFFGMDNRNAFPTKNLPPTSFDDDKAKETWTYDTLGQFVDKYVFPSWSGHVADDQV